MRARYAAVFALLVTLTLAAQTAPPAPSQFLGFTVGEDRKVADYRQIVSYFRALAAASPRVEVQDLGKTTMGEDMIMAVISSEANLRNQGRYQEIARKLADPRGLSLAEIDKLVAEGKSIVLVTCNIHSTEIGASQMAMEWAHALATASDAETKRRLDNVILLLVPSLNPDGQIMETEWYRKNLGTPYEGMRMPRLYHHYVGHDNNRDWYMLTQKESKAMSRAVYHEWFPQVWLDEHQMGSTGPRIFVPPYSDPVAQSIHPMIWRGVNMMGMNMAFRLEEARKSGVIYAYSYDAYWPGGTKNTGWWKNIMGLLTEVASARFASPIDLPAGELSGGRKGLIEYTAQTNFPNPWPGGRWTLRDIMDYERIVSDALLETTANLRAELLRAAATMAQDAIAEGRKDEYFVIPADQRDPVTAARLAHLMREHNVEVLVGGNLDFYIPTAQPYGKFVREMLGTDGRYPEVKAVAGENIIQPYDVSAWSLPLMMGVDVRKVTLASDTKLRKAADNDWPKGGLAGDASASVFALRRDSNNASRLLNALLKSKANVSVARESFRAADRTFPSGTLLIERRDDLTALATKHRVELVGLAQPPKNAAKLAPVRVGLYKPWMASMDEGWTRWVLEQYEFDLKNVDNKQVRAGKLKEAFDAIVLPDLAREIIIEGKPRREEDAMRYFQEFPPEYAGGIGKEGVEKLKEFVKDGGVIIAMSGSADLLMEDFNIPVRNALARVRPDDFRAPGTILRVHVDPDHPVTYGMPEDAAIFLTDRIAYQTAMGGAELERSVLAWYPERAEDILLSGWIRGAERLEKRAAAVAFRQGKGKLVLLGFRPQHRAQTEGTFKMLFNSIFWAGMEE